MVSKYYDASRLLSHQGIFNFAVGKRGNGKTYDGKRRGIRNAIKKGEEFIYLRRYKTELVASKDSFFADIAHEFPNKEFRVMGNKGQMAEYLDPDTFAVESDYRRELKAREWQNVVHFIALSTAQKQKSVAYPKVTLILYDEFIIEKGALHYLPNEELAFKNFYLTVDRYREMNGRKPVIALFIANSVSIMNPYFIAYDIVPDGKEFIRRKNGFVIVQFIEDSDFSEAIYQTRFGKFIEDSDYAEYAVGNKFSDNNDSLVMIKGNKARYQFTLECHDGSFSVWYDMVNNNFFIQDKLPKTQDVYTLVPEKMSENKTLMTVRDKPIAYLRASFNNARVLFDKPSTRNTFREIFKR